MDPASLLRTAKLLAVPIPFFLGGYSYAFSQNAVPGILDRSADVNTPIFKHVFHTGALVIVPGALLGLATSAYLAYVLPAQRTLWGAAAIANVAPLIWTQLVMSSGIKRLIAISEDRTMQEKATADLEHRQLLSQWMSQNYVRVALYVGAGLAALNATLAA
ncbi:hypothetical protein LTR53_008146 [Teratosphaeriaceae sp. CCFEE 6253]|nr:hypothetical protein LTR53_008146 [Teratosphaeriaceae sp. CCFEE 6253]